VLLCRCALPGFDSRRYAAGESQLVEFDRRGCRR
jgi:hypothetical protein